MLDHPARRQIRELVVIGRSEQVSLKRLLLGDVGESSTAEVAVGNAHRPVAGRSTCRPGHRVGFLRATGERRLRRSSMQAFAALAPAPRRRRRRRLLVQRARRCSVDYRREAALLVPCIMRGPVAGG